MCAYILQFLVFFIVLCISKFHWFPSAWRISWRISFLVVSLPVKNSVSFCSCESLHFTFLFASSIKFYLIVFLDSFQHLKYITRFSPGFRNFWQEACSNEYLYSFVCNMPFFSGYFYDFYLYHSFYHSFSIWL